MLKPDCARRKSCQSAFGQGFDSPQLHHLDRTRTRECGPFSLILQKIDVGLDTRPLQGHFSRRNVLALPAEAVDFPHQEAVEAPILRVSQHPLKLVTASSAPEPPRPVANQPKNTGYAGRIPYFLVGIHSSPHCCQRQASRHISSSDRRARQCSTCAAFSVPA